MMDTYSIDNSIDAVLKRVITWQYDHARNLVAMVVGVFETVGGTVVNIGLLKKFWDGAVRDFWDGIRDKLNIANRADVTTVSEFGLAVWGKLVGVPRPMVTYQKWEDTAPHQYAMTTQLYRRLLIGRFRLSNSNASYWAYRTFVNFVFGNSVNVTDGQDMSLSFAYVKTIVDPTPLPENPTPEQIAAYNLQVATYNEDTEQQAAVETLADVIFAYPAGVKSHDQDVGPVLGFVTQPVYATSVYGTRCSVQVTNTTASSITLPSGSKFTATVDSVSRTYVLDGGYTGAGAYTIAAGGTKIFGFNCNGVIAFVDRGTAVTVTNNEGTTVSGLSSKVLCSSDYDTNLRTETVVTSVIVRVFGTVGTVVPIGAKFTQGSGTSAVTFATTVAYTVASHEDGNYVDARFSAAGEHYVNARTVTAITNSSGQAIANITSVTNRSRSESSSDTQTVGTSVIVRVFGTVGTVVPIGAKFTQGSGTSAVTFATTVAYTVASHEDGNYVDARFSAAGEHYVKARTVTAITNSRGQAIANITSATNRSRSMTDFKIGNFKDANQPSTGASVFAWKRFNDR